MVWRARATACLLASALLAGALPAAADTHYVALYGSHAAPFSSWATAATNIQDAIDVAEPGDLVLVTNGVYNAGGASRFGLWHRVAITNPVSVRSVNGYRNTAIVGEADAGGLGPAATRCVYIASGALIGFTLRSGYTADAGALGQVVGGGLLMTGGTVDACRVAGNMAAGEGGGAWMGNGECRSSTFLANYAGTPGSGVKIQSGMTLGRNEINNYYYDYPAAGLLGTNLAAIADGDYQPSLDDGTDYGQLDASAATAEHTFFITNSGVRPLNIGGITTNGGQAAEFTITSGPGAAVLAPGAVTPFTVEFNPADIGRRSTIFHVASDDPDDDPYAFMVQGEGIEPDVLVLGTNLAVITNGTVTTTLADGTDYGDVDVSAGYTDHVFTITNAGGGALHISGIATNGADPDDFIVISVAALTLNPGETTALTVRFDPLAEGARAAILEIASDEPDTPFTFAVSGRGVEPHMLVLGTNLAEIANGDVVPLIDDGTDFGLCTGQVTHVFTVTNYGLSTLELTNTPVVAIYGHDHDFIVTAQPTTPIAIGGTAQFAVRFLPTVLGARTALVEIANNTPTENPYQFALRGDCSNAFVDSGVNLVGLRGGAAAWGDYDNDGDLDLVMAGYTNLSRYTVVYSNRGDATFGTADLGLPNMESAALAWGDYDADGYLDLALSGKTAAGLITRIYRNAAGGVLTNINTELPGVQNGGMAWVDYNNDGRLDLSFCGFTLSNNVTRLYRNLGNGSFSNVVTGIAGYGESSLAWADYNHDGYQDLAIQGLQDNNFKSLAIYRNVGGTQFVNSAMTFPGGSAYGRVAWGDFDSDGHVDLVSAGFASNGPTVRVYRNNGAGTLTNYPPARIQGVWLADVAWGDYDHDGDLDLAMSGVTTNERISRVYQNRNGTFTNVQAGLDGVWLSAVAWADDDNDGDLDLLVSGQTLSNYETRIYRNLAPSTNTPPGAPSNLSLTVTNGNNVVLRWDAATDDATPASGLTYNVYVGTAPGQGDLCPALAATTGWRRVVARGNAQQALSWKLERFPAGTLYWGVQAIDGHYAGSEFAVGNSFSRTGLPEFVISRLAYDPIPFTVYVTVSNRGALAGDAGQLAVWANRAAAAPCGAASDQTNAVGSLDPGQALQVVFSGLSVTNGTNASVLRAFVNSTCTAEEEDTGNNQASLTYAIPVYPDFWFRAFAVTNQVYLRWINPMDCGLQNATVKVLFNTDHHPANTSDGTELYTGTAQFFHHTGLPDDVTNFYTIWVSNDGATFVDPP